MTPPRFYITDTLGIGSHAELPDSAAHHAVRVLRLKPGDSIVLFNGDGFEYPSQITDIVKRTVTVEITEQKAISRESPLVTTLIQAVTNSDKMDFTIQKAVELGVARIMPVISDRCVIRLNSERAEKRHKHWQGIIISACEQCGRNRLPDIDPVVSLDTMVSATSVSDELRLLLTPDAQTSIKKELAPPQSVSFLVGPEGGLTDTEIRLLVDNGFHPVRLGPRVLRTETAASVVLSVIQTLWGDF